MGRLLEAQSQLGQERFAFDPAGNMAQAVLHDSGPAALPREQRQRPAPAPLLLDNLLKEYAGTHYRYDERGNLIERTKNGRKTRFSWDGFNRMTAAHTEEGSTTFRYDPLGRRIAKHWATKDGATTKQSKEAIFGWDGDTLAYESSQSAGPGASGKQAPHSVHYVHEKDSFVPLVQVRRATTIQLSPASDVKVLMQANGGAYDIAQDPLWNGQAQQQARQGSAPFQPDEIVFYQCDHLGTPQEMTDANGDVCWSANYKAWGEARQAISEAAGKAGITNPIRFQGQYADEETGLHYNRYRYYDPQAGRFVSSDPIKLAGGFNLQQYAPNPTEWIDPWGLSSCALVYRSMKTGADGQPLPEPTARGLGARVPIDIPVDAQGNVHPNTGGVSVAPYTPGNLPSHRRPTTLGGTGRDDVWGIDSGDLGPDLRYVQDCPTHGTIQPTRTMPANEYQDALKRTKSRWRKP